jgi:hypothetical protein
MARALTPRGLENLTAAAKLLSYVRFFHPSDQAVGVVSWDHFAVAMLERCESAEDASALALQLKESIAEIAPTIDVWAGTPAQAPPQRALLEGAQQMVMWKHLGPGSADREPVQACYARISKQISAATEGYCRIRFVSVLGWQFPTPNPVQFVLVKPNGRKLRVGLARSMLYPPDQVESDRPVSGAPLAPGVVYFDLRAAAPAKVMARLATAKGIVFDLRGSPDIGAREVLGHLIDEPVECMPMSLPLIRRPDREDEQWIELTRWQIEPVKPRWKAKTAFLVDARVMGSGETFMTIVEHYQLGEMVGSATAGNDGVVTSFTLPGGYDVYWTGMRVLKHDATTLHGVGIKPTFPVTPTAKGIAAGRDEVLEKAIEVLKARPAAPARPAK